MVFSSALFLFYFLPIFLAGYFLVAPTWRNSYTAGASLVFYAWGAPNFLLLFLGSCLCDYLIVGVLSSQKTIQRRRGLLALSTVINIGLLLYFKYANFFVAQLGSIVQALGLSAPHWSKIALPIGISFFTFHKISYVVDVFRGTSRPTRNFGEYLLYITFFPQLIAGPIVRYHEIEGQIRSRVVTFEHMREGVWRFVVGLSAKLLLADPLGNVASHVFKGDPWNVSTGYTWLGTLAYSLQIYFDFAGYSSMAVGLALLVGFRFPENFNHPYLSGSITEFWRRWHISLSRWMRDYLYIPLGGNRVSPSRQALNLWTVFLISGLWHGASWNFIVWGAYHGAFLAIERTPLGRAYLDLPPLVRRAMAFITVMFGWVLFRSDTLSDGMARWGRLIGFGGPVASEFQIPRAFMISDVGLGILIIGCAWCLLVEPLLEKMASEKTGQGPLYREFPLAYPILAVLFALCVLAVEAGRYSPFIYFQF
jgi:alginate O-acetyltransferase complex protein AlgI